MLDPHHLLSFQEIARTGSYSAAARRLGYTQPALSYQMRLLERSVGTPLTARSGRVVRLTPAGRALLRHADQILTAIRVAERDLAGFVGKRAGVLRIASFSSASATLVADALARVTAAHPAIDPRLSHADPLEATAAVMRGDADLAVTYRYGVEALTGAPATVRADATSALRRSPLTTVPLLTDQVHLVLPSAHPQAGTPITNLLPFAEERFLVGSDLFTGLLQGTAGRAGFVARIVTVADDCAGMLALAARGVGLALLPGLELLAVRRDDVVALPLPDWPTRHVAVETWPDLLRVPSVAATVAALQEAAVRILDSPAAAGMRFASQPVGHSGPFGDATDDPGDESWRTWFDVTVTTLPRTARDEPDLGVVISDASGTEQVHAWRRGSGVGAALTARPGGVALADVSADGANVWWFADDQGDERGVWMVQRFDDRDATPAAPDIAPGQPSGLAVGTSRVAIGRSDHDGAEIFVLDLGRDGRGVPASLRRVYDSPEFAVAGPLSADEGLLAISHSEHGNSLKPAIRVIRLARDGESTVADLFDGSGFGVWPRAFSPVAGSADLLVMHERHGRARPLIWNPITGAEREIDPQLPGETTASWYPDGSALLVLHQYRARSDLHRVELDGSSTRLSTRRGFISDATPRRDGGVDYVWSSATEPPRLLDTEQGDADDGDHRDGDGDGDTTPAHVTPSPLTDMSVNGGGGDVHVLIARPAGDERAGPKPTVFLVHGGPGSHDADSYSEVRNAWASSGFVVVHVNYRGSTGYGAEWRNANLVRPGDTELEDIVAARDALVADGTTDPDRIVIAGRSWGGYLALRALGQFPRLWSLGIAIVPVADTATVYEDMMEQIRASYRVRFGGSPSEAPEAYAASSPLSVVADVDVPVLITGGLRDPRCPIRQIELYVSRLVELGKQHELHIFDRGHDARSRAERIDEMSKVLAFARRHLARS